MERDELQLSVGEHILVQLSTVSGSRMKCENSSTNKAPTLNVQTLRHYVFLAFATTYEFYIVPLNFRDARFKMAQHGSTKWLSECSVCVLQATTYLCFATNQQ